MHNRVKRRGLKYRIVCALPLVGDKRTAPSFAVLQVKAVWRFHWIMEAPAPIKQASNKRASQPASQPASVEESKQARQPASEGARKQVSKQAFKLSWNSCEQLDEPASASNATKQACLCQTAPSTKTGTAGRWASWRHLHCDPYNARLPWVLSMLTSYSACRLVRELT